MYASSYNNAHLQVGAFAQGLQGNNQFQPIQSVQGVNINAKIFESPNANSNFPITHKRIPIKIILNDDEATTTEYNSETTEENSIYQSPHNVLSNGNYFPVQMQVRQIQQMQVKYPHWYFIPSVLKESSSNRKVVYIFNILKSRKKEKKYLRKKYNKVISRVHNMDCLLKKIKAKFLKFLFLNIKKDLKELKIDVKKFDQCKEVRNLNVPHNRDKFINLSILEVLINNNIIDQNDCRIIFSSSNNSLKDFLSKKVKYQYQFEFLKSNYFRNWLTDPIKIGAEENVNFNKNCEKFPNHSKNIFKSNHENYERYKKLLLHTACNFLFYFQNNPLKFGKKQRE